MKFNRCPSYFIGLFIALQESLLPLLYWGSWSAERFGFQPRVATRGYCYLTPPGFENGMEPEA